MKIEAIESAHWEGVLEIQSEAYQQVGLEDLAVLKSKSEASPETCFVCLSDEGQVQGYLLAHLWSGHQPPKLFTRLPVIEAGDHLYLHDIAVSSRARGQGVGGELFEALERVSRERGITKLRLVAVQGAASYWARLGFNEVRTTRVCPSYGNDAVMMEKALVF
ncbi:GNAT family N-acetyltransferase [Marinobacterium lutimaris]|uniref:L-amino acid N-acyltransferase YncA n=1 Tax=Marinobacterium lutimaris TaxID=568106 RepID=A0A1H5XAY6_9GAMM|nr:GNAT family N-acetyltransferase [Marinobacterium lutimaris]SEG08922.1 L-amino acid N-acyltransferase YncA [Marinobacterium lutimaris]